MKHKNRTMEKSLLSLVKRYTSYQIQPYLKSLILNSAKSNSSPNTQSTRSPASKTRPPKELPKAVRLPFEFTLLDTATPPLYQQISAKSVQLHQLGLSKNSIAAKLNVDEKTVSKAIRWINEIWYHSVSDYCNYASIFRFCG